MIDVHQLPRNPALERWKSELRDEGRVEGEARGRVEGEARGRVEGEARLLVRILRRRGFDVTAAVEARVLATVDADLIERWADRALVAATLDAVFAEG